MPLWFVLVAVGILIASGGVMVAILYHDLRRKRRRQAGGARAGGTKKKPHSRPLFEACPSGEDMPYDRAVRIWGHRNPSSSELEVVGQLLTHYRTRKALVFMVAVALK